MTRRPRWRISGTPSRWMGRWASDWGRFSRTGSLFDRFCNKEGSRRGAEGAEKKQFPTMRKCLRLCRGPRPIADLERKLRPAYPNAQGMAATKEAQVNFTPRY